MIAIQVIIICTCTSFEETDGLVLLWTKLLLTNIQKIQNITIYIYVCVLNFDFTTSIYDSTLFITKIWLGMYSRYLIYKLKCKLIEKKLGSIWRFRIVFRGACWQLWLGWAMGTLINNITFLKSSADPGGSSPLCSLKWDQEMSSRYWTPSLVCVWVESFNDREITPSVVTFFSPDLLVHYFG